MRFCCRFPEWHVRADAGGQGGPAGWPGHPVPHRCPPEQAGRGRGQQLHRVEQGILSWSARCNCGNHWWCLEIHGFWQQMSIMIISYVVNVDFEFVIMLNFTEKPERGPSCAVETTTWGERESSTGRYVAFLSILIQDIVTWVFFAY